MKIPADILSEKNYEGTRVIKIEDPTLSKLQVELNKFQQSINPFLAEMEKLTPKMDPVYAEINKHHTEIKKLQEEVAPVRAEYDALVEKITPFEQKAQVVKNKMLPIVNKLIKEQLGEFETATNMNEKDGVFTIEVRDEIEEKVKAIRASKAK